MAEKSHLWNQSGKINDPGTDCGNAARQISPPPLKRQRTNPESSHSFPDRSRTTAGPSQLSLPQEEASRRHSSITGTLKPTAKSSFFRDERSRLSVPISGFVKPQTDSDQDQNSGPSKSITGSSSRASSASESKPKCRVCLKNTNVKYDPIIICLGCHRQYHDSCRKPALSGGVATRDWRCFKCLNDGSRRTSKFRTSDSFTSDVLAISPGPHSVGHPSPAPEASVHVQMRLAESHKGRKIIEESVPDVPPAPREQETVRPLSDSHDNRCGGVGEHVQQKDVATFDTTTPAADSSNLVLLDGSTGHANPYKAFIDTRTVLNRPFPSAQTNAEIPERTEVPDTPTQRSSQLNNSSPAPHLWGGADWSPSQGDDSMLTEPIARAHIAIETVACSVCRNQRLLAKEGSTKAICQRCQDRTRIAQSGKSEIPESPGATSDTPRSGCGGNTPSATKSTAPSFHAVENEAPVPWFESGLVGSTIKIKQKKIRIPQPPIASREVEIRRKDPAAIAPVVSATQTSTERQPVGYDQRDGSKDRHASVSDNQAKFVSSHNQESASSHVQGSRPGSAAVSEQITVPPATPSSKDIVRQLPPGDLHATNSVSMDRRRSYAHAQYTMRQLARIALVSANGSRMTSSQILLCIARTFPSLKVGEGGWEKSVQACLSRFDEFDSRKIPGAQGSKKLYGFSSMAFKTRYEQEYAEFCVAPELHRESLKAQQKIVVDDNKRQSKQRPTDGAVKSASSLHRPSSTIQMVSTITPEARVPTTTVVEKSAPLKSQSPSIPKQLGSSMAAERRTPMTPTKQTEEGMEFMPFQRTVPHQHVVTLDTIMSAQKETSFRDTFAADLRSIDNMTETEKAQKVAQITARPSRKKYFGSGYRLAHRRHHDLADIHDESDGAWKPPRLAMKVQQVRGDQDEEMGLGEEGRRSLREVFDLPDNMIPMNDGHTELAFRDGILINGRLPRPRNVYKVGKMFGGELTIRTS